MSWYAGVVVVALILAGVIASGCGTDGKGKPVTPEQLKATVSFAFHVGTGVVPLSQVRITPKELADPPTITIDISGVDMSGARQSTTVTAPVVNGEVHTQMEVAEGTVGAHVTFNNCDLGDYTDFRGASHIHAGPNQVEKVWNGTRPLLTESFDTTAKGEYRASLHALWSGRLGYAITDGTAPSSPNSFLNEACENWNRHDGIRLSPSSFTSGHAIFQVSCYMWDDRKGTSFGFKQSDGCCMAHDNAGILNVDNGVVTVSCISQNLATFQKQRWYTFKADVNLSTHRIDVWMDGVKIGNSLPLLNDPRTGYRPARLQNAAGCFSILFAAARIRGAYPRRCPRLFRMPRPRPFPSRISRT